MTSASSDSLIASKKGGWKQPPKTSETTKSMTMKFVPDIGIDKRHKIKIRFGISGPVCKLQTKVLKKQILGIKVLGMLTSQNFARL